MLLSSFNGLAAALCAAPSLNATVLEARPDNDRLERTKPNRGAQWAPRLIGFAAQPERCRGGCSPNWLALDAPPAREVEPRSAFLAPPAGSLRKVSTLCPRLFPYKNGLVSRIVDSVHGCFLENGLVSRIVDYQACSSTIPD